VEGLLHWEENEPRRDSTAFYDNQRADAAKEAAKGVDFPKVAKPPSHLPSHSRTVRGDRIWRKQETILFMAVRTWHLSSVSALT